MANVEYVINSKGAISVNTLVLGSVIPLILSKGAIVLINGTISTPDCHECIFGFFLLLVLMKMPLTPREPLALVH